jgi:hypothetical protein
MQFKPSNIISAVAGLAKTAVSAIPIGGKYIVSIVPQRLMIPHFKGPLLSEGIDVLASTFSGADVPPQPAGDTRSSLEYMRTCIADTIAASNKTLSTEIAAHLDRVSKLFEQSQIKFVKDVTTGLDTVAAKMDAAEASAQLQRIQTRLEKFRDPIKVAIDWFRKESALDNINENNLKLLTQWSPDAQFQEYLPNEGNPAKTDMMSHRKALEDTIQPLQDFLSEGEVNVGGIGGAGTQAALELYMTAVTWLLIYDKVSLRLNA